MTKGGWIATAVALAMAAYLLFWPVPIDPARWSPPEAPQLEGDYAANDGLTGVEQLPVGRGPETVAVSDDGTVICGLEDGSIVRASFPGSTAHTVTVLDGRPLGIEFAHDGQMIVCDLYGRLLAISSEGDVQELAAEVDGEALGLVNDVAIGNDGTIYFSESSTETTDTLLDMLEHRAHGRLLAYRPDGTVEALLDGLYYANGVALSRDEAFVVVAETTAYRIRRFWLSGPRRGEDEIFVDNLPGFPDGISCDAHGVFWIAMMNPRNPFLDWTMERPWLREIAARLPLSWFDAAAPRYGFVLGLDAEGRVIRNLQDPTGDAYAGISSAVRHEAYLYLGSLLERAIGRLLLSSPTDR